MVDFKALSVSLAVLAGGGLAIIATLCLSGCQTGRAVFTAPALVTYTPAQQAAVANELAACGHKCDALAGFVGDYGKLRAAIRVIDTKQK